MYPVYCECYKQDLKNFPIEIYFDNSNPEQSLIIDNEGELVISHKHYKAFVDTYKLKGDLDFTIPEEFVFQQEAYVKKEADIERIIRERNAEIDAILTCQFRANELDRNMFGDELENMIEKERRERMERVEVEKQKLLLKMKPFSFQESDERRFKEKKMRVAQPPQFEPFKASSIPYTSQLLLFEDMVLKEQKERERRVLEKIKFNQQNSKLPPRMEMHEKNKQDEDAKRMKEAAEADLRRRKELAESFKAKEVPNFQQLHAEFYDKMDKMKKEAILTEPKPFNFNAPKKDVRLHKFLDRGNKPELKNHYSQESLSGVIKRIQKKPKLEPATTKSLNLLMETVLL